MVNGTLYAHGGNTPVGSGAGSRHGRSDVSVMAEHEVREPRPSPRQLSGRGLLAYWTDGKEERVTPVTPAYFLDCAGCQDGSPHTAKASAIGAGWTWKLNDDQEILPDLTTGKSATSQRR